MTASLGEVIGRIRAALDLAQKVEQHLHDAEELAREAADLLAPIGRGSSHEAEYQRVIGGWSETAEEVEHLRGILANARETIERYLASLDGASFTATNLRTRSVKPTPERPGHPVPDERIEQVRSTLRRGPDGSQTTGWWLRGDGSRVRLLSGEDADPDGWQKKAERFLRDAFPDEGPSLLSLARHVEIKLAVRLRERKKGSLNHEVMVIDRTVCGRDERTRNYPYTCAELLPYVLDEGMTLTIVEQDGTRVTYHGRGTE